VQGVIHERFEHRRGQALEIKICRAGDDAGKELGRILKQMHESVGVLQDARGDHLRRALFAEEENWQAVIAATLFGEDFFQDLPL
jgi:hypothetical protein